MNSVSWLPVLASAALGLCAAGLAWSMLTALDAVPPEDRAYKDRPPVAFRRMWWPIRWLSHYLGPLLPIGYRQRLLVRLRQAGLDYAMSAEQFTAASVVACLAAWGLAAGLLAAWQRPAVMLPLVAAAAGGLLPSIWLRDRIGVRRRETLKTLPFVIDIITLCVEAGLNLTGAFAHAAAKGPVGPLRDGVECVLRDVRAGRPRIEALRGLADRMNDAGTSSLVSALVQAEAMGMALGPILRAQSEQRRAERFARAEKLAMEAPVKLLFPLIAFIFPCTFLVLGFPIAMKFIHMGL
ncbi:MAG TPA: type II secretion system F family protein [Albitalea sp.]|uniref:type II secretion system F family protein n=1 Tax=Piscinibacter sp. TaxID=1903157 RepID=UPI002ED10AEE